VTAAGLAYGCALALAVLFVVAALSKLRDRPGTAQAFASLGVPQADAAARLVPLLELVIALALVAVPAVGGVVALVTLAFFTTFLVGRLRAGVTAPCACFGGSTTEPLSLAKITDNAFMMVAALAAASASGPIAPSVVDLLVVASLGAAAVLTHLAVRPRGSR
jgi:uncharacterized membrane protein YphA (DoxX/SURF4 family)